MSAEVFPVLFVACCLPMRAWSGEKAKTVPAAIAVMSKMLATIRRRRRTLCFPCETPCLDGGRAEKFVIDIKVLCQRAVLALNCPRVVDSAVATFKPPSKGLPLIFCGWTRVGAFLEKAEGIGGVFFGCVEGTGRSSGTVRIPGLPRALINSRTLV